MYDRRFLFLNLGHGYAHLFLLLYPTVVLALEEELGMPYGELLLPSTAGFAAFAAGTLPAGWLGDRWSREGMLAAMFLGLGAGALATGFARTPLELAGGLALIGLFAAIYHPVGIAMVVEGAHPVGRRLGINGVFGNLGVAGAPLTAGLLSELLGWRWAFFLPGLVALATGIAFLLLVRTAGPAGPRRAAEAAPPADGRARIVLFLVVSALFGGLVFDVTTILFPKLLDQNLGGSAGGPLGAGGLASLVFASAAFAQIAVGTLIDRFPVRPVAVLLMTLQVPLLALVGVLAGWASVVLAFAVMLLVFGAIPINDALVARSSSAAWRARLYSLKYMLSIGVGAAAVPTIVLLQEPGGGFARLFALLALFMVVVAAAALALPVGGARGRPLAVQGPG